MEKRFELKSFKVDAFGIVDCKYRIVVTDDDGITTEHEHHVKESRPIHPDLDRLFSQDLFAIAADIFGETEESAADDRRIDVRGIVFAGKNDNIGISIQGLYHTAVGGVAFKTPRIKYLIGESDVCVKLTDFAAKIVTEAQSYLFDGKGPELGVFGE